MKSSAFLGMVPRMALIAKTFGGVAILGASRGLGLALARHLHRQEVIPLFLASRSLLPAELASAQGVTHLQADFSKPEDQDLTLKQLRQFNPRVIVVAAAGGPYGAFAGKQWKDHRWALEVSLLFPLRVAGAALGGEVPGVEQLVLVGSSVAESQSDPKAASYAAAKHGLMGFHRSVAGEDPGVDIRLFSPGYMDTSLLPPGSAPRQRRLWNPEDVARDLWDWLQRGPRHSHRRLAVFPGSD